MKRNKFIENKIYIVGNITEEAFLDFTQKLTVLELAGFKEVFVELSSGGGNAYDALAFYSRIRLSPCKITVTAIGLVASAAVLILAGADRRCMAREAWVMTHEDETNKFTGKVTALEEHAKHLRNMENQWNELLAKHTKISLSGWTQVNKKDFYMTAQDCLRYGLIEEII